MLYIFTTQTPPKGLGSSSPKSEFEDVLSSRLRNCWICVYQETIKKKKRKCMYFIQYIYTGNIIYQVYSNFIFLIACIFTAAGAATITNLIYTLAAFIGTTNSFVFITLSRMKLLIYFNISRATIWIPETILDLAN